MQLTDADIAHLATLARLALGPDQRERFAEQLSTVLEYLDQVNGRDHQQESAIRPRVALRPADFRADVVLPTPSDELIAQAPQREGHSVVSPPVG